jgi:hypothetical protein
MCLLLRFGEVGGEETSDLELLAGAGGQLVILEAEMVLWRNFDLDDVIVKGQ